MTQSFTPAAAIERKDVRDLTDDETDLLREAFRRLQNLPSSDRRRYSYQVGIHGNHCPHGNWWFLPWHRAYLFYFEQLLQNAVRDLNPPKLPTIPYWNWTEQRELPRPFRGTFPANPLANNTRYNLQLSNNYVGAQEILRVVDQANTFIAFGSNRAQTKLAETGKSQFEFRPHDHVHLRVGDHMDDPPTAVRDPIFWSHHANIDRLWVYWLSLPNHRNPREDSPQDRPWYTLTLTEFVDTAGNLVTRTIKEIMEDTALQSVVYIPFSGRSLPAVAAVPAKSKEAPVSTQNPEPVSVEAVVPAGCETLLRLGRPVTLTFPMTDAFRQRIQALYASQPVRGSVLLRVHGLQLPQSPPPAEIRIFLNRPTDDGVGSPQDSQFVGALPLFDFGGAHGHAGRQDPGHGMEGVNRLVDLTWVLQTQITAHAYALGEPLKVTFVLTPENAEDQSIQKVGEIPDTLTVRFAGATLVLEE